ncbi:MmgE/PrpD family protein [Paeniroseomonas aquatica]|uniref:MmgE/PrpD family protein n=1 Tax=Paeniroseomonas aquatica TaxID=373043 RepID=A0ABT8A168_9PROT|nr:MmgE/PrpD family protein [Paeniroseomonas aquatica]MDN3563279.1 MmgE/PrpD family protein [Paeniroseomonas aquatica]
MDAAPPLLAHATRDLAAFAAGLDFEAIPAAVIAQVKLSLLDGIGVCLHGATLPWTRQVQALALAEGATPAATLWGTGRRGSWAQAALVNGTAGHGFEMDDIHKESILHPNSLTTPVALGFAEMRGGLPGRDLLTAIVAGYETGTRVGNAATMALFLNGFHPQGTSGVFCAAAAAGRLLGLDAARMRHGLGIAGSMGAGLMAAQEGAMVKRLHAGRAAESGVRAALLAEAGFTGISDVLEAPYGGFLSALARTPAAARLTAGLGEDWETAKTGFKMYPSVTSIHSALDALRHVMAEAKLAAADIARIEVGVGHMTHVHTAWPYRPAGVTAAQMNIFFGLAVTALHGAPTAGFYREAYLADPAILGFIPRIAVTEDAELEAMGAPFRHACRMVVHARDGGVHRHEVLHRRASPENPVSPAEVEAKFRANVAGMLDAAATGRVVALVAGLETLASSTELTELLARAG